MRRFLTILAALALAALATLAATAVPPNLNKALEAQRQLTDSRPQDPGVWNDYGNLLLLANHPEDAEAAYRRAVELDPKKVSALFNLGLLEQQRGNRKEALALFQQVVQIEPRHAWAHYQIGAVYEAWKREAKAIDAYSQAFALDPQLAFRDVNPQVVDSKLVTQAMLKAYREGARPPEAPKLYDDPGRIAGLLVTQPATAPDPSAAAAPAKPGAKKAPTPPAGPGAVVAPGAAVPGAGMPGSPAQAPTVLREGNIERGSPVGQALPPGQSRRPPPLPGRGARPGATVPGQTWVRPTSPNVDEDEENGNGGAYIPTPPPVPGAAVPPAGVIYQPTVPSTGRFGVKLIPGRERIAALGVHRG